MWSTFITFISIKFINNLSNNSLKNFSPEEIERVSLKQYPGFYPYAYGFYIFFALTIIVILITLVSMLNLNLLMSDFTGYVEQQQISASQLILFLAFLGISIAVACLALCIPFMYLETKFSLKFRDYIKYQQIKNGHLAEDGIVSKVISYSFIIFLVIYFIFIVLFYFKILHF